MVNGLIGFRVLQDNIQMIAKIYSKGGVTCWKIIQNAEPNVLAAFIQIGNSVYPPEKLICWSSKLYVFICSVQLGRM